MCFTSFFQIFGSFGVRGQFGIRSRSVQANFGPKFSESKFKISKTFNLCGRRCRGGGPLAAVPSPAARRAPAAAAAAAPTEKFAKNFRRKQ